MSGRIDFPGQARFAFTILDDTDDSTLENVRPVYDLLREYGFRTTKTAWPFETPGGSRLFFAADTLERAEYRAFVHELVEDGFELASHGASMEPSKRDVTLRSLDFYEQEFGFCPTLHANHAQNRENLYWGQKRFHTPGLRQIARVLATGFPYDGEDPDSEYFWGDVARERFRYIRNFTFRGLDMRRANPEMPYRLSATPHVSAWFSTTDAPNADVFAARVTEAALDQLEEEGGICIISTHLGKGFCENGRVRSDIDRTLESLAKRAGHFVPVSQLLDEIVEQQGMTEVGAFGLAKLEFRYLVEKALDRLPGA